MRKREQSIFSRDNLFITLYFLASLPARIWLAVRVPVADGDWLKKLPRRPNAT